MQDLTPKPVEFAPEDRRALELLAATPGEIRGALNALNGSLVRLLRSAGTSSWTFKHPTIADAYASLVAEDPELLDIYLRGAKPHRLLQEVVCGAKLIKGAKVVVPSSRYSLVTDRLKSIPVGSEDLLFFLATRCGKRFLQFYIGSGEELTGVLLQRVYSIRSSASVALMARLYDYGLLPETCRKQLIERAHERAVSGLEADFLGVKSIRSMFTEEEVIDLLSDAKEKLLKNIDMEIIGWEQNYEPPEDPEEYFDPLVSCLQALEAELGDDPEVSDVFDAAYGSIETSIGELRSVYSEDEESDYETFSSGDRTGIAVSERSIFDDVDQ